MSQGSTPNGRTQSDKKRVRFTWSGYQRRSGFDMTPEEVWKRGCAIQEVET
jgi:hypothetical protein